MKILLVNLCRPQTHCITCRDPKAQAWRDGISKAYDVPADWPTCPKGYPMGAKIEAPERIPLTPEQAAAQAKRGGCCNGGENAG
jgi:hypothetical protein